MADIKFQTIAETPIGALGKSMMRRWQALLRRRKQLEARQQKLDDDTSAFFEKLGKMTPDNDEVNAQHGFRLSEDGVIYAQHCDCYHCQAKVQGLRTSTVVEAMIRQGMLRGDDAVTARRNAAEIDSKAAGTEEKKKQLLLN